MSLCLTLHHHYATITPARRNAQAISLGSSEMTAAGIHLDQSPCMLGIRWLKRTAYHLVGEIYLSTGNLSFPGKVRCHY